MRSFYFLDFRHTLPCRCITFFAKIVRCPVVCPIFDSPTQFTLFFLCIFWTLYQSQIHPPCMWALFHCLLLFSCHQIPLHQVAALSMHYSSIFYFVTYHQLFKIIWPELLLYGSMDGCYESFILLFVGMISFFYNTFWFEGVLPFS